MAFKERFLCLFVLCIFISVVNAVEIPDEDFKLLLERMSNLERKVERQDLIEIQVQGLQKELQQQKNVITKQQMEIENLQQQLEQRKENSDNNEVIEDNAAERINGFRQITRRSFPEVSVAFSARLDHDVEHAGIDQTIIFNRVLLNDGNSYNRHTGVFTVPKEGMYLFYFVVASGYEPHKDWVQLVVDGKCEYGGVAQTLQFGHDVQGSNLIMLHLQPGNSIWIKNVYNSDAKIFGLVDGLTTFSGVLLYEY